MKGKPWYVWDWLAAEPEVERWEKKGRGDEGEGEEWEKRERREKALPALTVNGVREDESFVMKETEETP